MILYIFIIVLYASFLIEFLLWPVSSEASTRRLLQKRETNLMIRNLVYVLIFIFNFVFTLIPLFLSIYFLVFEKRYEVAPLAFPGILIAWIGRLFSLKGAHLLNHNTDKRLVTESLFKWSRNPISFGLYITFLGLVMVYTNLFLILGWIIFLVNINFKIGIEERFLKEKYGDIYLNYQKSTPKYLFI